MVGWDCLFVFWVCWLPILLFGLFVVCLFCCLVVFLIELRGRWLFDLIVIWFGCLLFGFLGWFGVVADLLI